MGQLCFVLKLHRLVHSVFMDPFYIYFPSLNLRNKSCAQKQSVLQIQVMNVKTRRSCYCKFAPSFTKIFTKPVTDDYVSKRDQGHVIVVIVEHSMNLPF